MAKIPTRNPGTFRRIPRLTRVGWAILALLSFTLWLVSEMIQGLTETRDEWSEYNRLFSSPFRDAPAPISGASPAKSSLSSPVQIENESAAPESPQIVTPPIAPRSFYDPDYRPTSRGDAPPISGVAVVTTYHPSDKDGGGWTTAMGTRVREGVAAVKSDYFQRLKGSVIEINGKRFVIEDCGPFYGKNERAVDVARFGLSGFKKNGLDVMRITVIETKNPEAWKAYLQRAEDAARRKGFIKEAK